MGWRRPWISTIWSGGENTSAFSISSAIRWARSAAAFPATMSGSAAADVAHMLAELIDNALIYSPPDQAVEVRGRLRPDGYTFAIVDAGMGMAPDELERANRRLAGAESMTVAPSKYLGHYVVGKLAALHDIRVALHQSPGTGLTATVTLPRQMLHKS